MGVSASRPRSRGTEAGHLASPGELAVAGERLLGCAARRALDIAFSTLMMLALAPVMLAVATAIRLDSRGPSLFRQRRLGRGLEPFTVHKFRTMRVDADPARHRTYVEALISGNGDTHQRADGQTLYKLAVDDRVTRVGRLLRRWSLDELPQLWDVLRGRMSLVGPRPVIAYEVEHYPGWYLDRFAVKPGLTGLWQVSGRNEHTYEEMVRFDIEYVERRSLRLDLVILVRTVWVVLSSRGAA